MSRFALAAVAAVVLFVALGSAEAGVRFTQVGPRGIATTRIGHNAAGKTVVSRTAVGYNGAVMHQKTVQGAFHSRTMTTYKAPNGQTVRTLSRN